MTGLADGAVTDPVGGTRTWDKHTDATRNWDQYAWGTRAWDRGQAGAPR